MEVRSDFFKCDRNLFECVLRNGQMPIMIESRFFILQPLKYLIVLIGVRQEIPWEIHEQPVLRTKYWFGARDTGYQNDIPVYRPTMPCSEKKYRYIVLIPGISYEISVTWTIYRYFVEKRGNCREKWGVQFNSLNEPAWDDQDICSDSIDHRSQKQMEIASDLLIYIIVLPPPENARIQRPQHLRPTFSESPAGCLTTSCCEKRSPNVSACHPKHPTKWHIVF
jgi:hypothetical protein